MILRKFQSTRPRGARLLSKIVLIFPRMFQSTRPRGARPGTAVGKLNQGGFNPRAHGGRDTLQWSADSSWAVSIHAPTGGATVTLAATSL